MDVSGGWLARLRRRWDYEADPERQLPFDQVLTQINLRRIELGLIASLADDLVEIYLNLADRMKPDGWLAVACIPVNIVFIVAAVRLRASKNLRAQMLLPWVVIVFTLLTTQAAIGLIAADGRVTDAYPLMLLIVPLFLVLPPRPLAATFLASLIPYAVMIGWLPIAGWEKLVADLNALMATGVAVGAGWLIYSARRRDHIQRLLIYRQNVLLVAREREMDEVMAITAHDLRSPVLGLRNLFRLTSTRAAAEPGLPLKVLREGERSLDSMLSLIGSLLESHQAEHDIGRPAVREDLRMQLAAAAARVGPLASTSRVEVVLNLADQPVFAVFDPVALAQILDNLLTNAVRFTPEGRGVFAGCRGEDGRAIIRIEDHGLGIAEQDRPFLFRKFSKGSTEAVHGAKGAGLGLFIVAKLAARIGATVQYSPVSPHGCAFEIVLPSTE